MPIERGASNKAVNILYDLITYFLSMKFQSIFISAVSSGFVAMKGEDEVDGEVEEEVPAGEDDIIAVPGSKVLIIH